MLVAIDREAVRHVAMLARLAMTDAELDRFTEQLRAILDYIGKLNELDTSAVEPLSHALTNVFRPDEPGGEPGCPAEEAGREGSPRLSQDEALANAPEREGGFFRVPRIIE
jgi:aspartyl-tRNA(Asn)/glutamyl-tRNA(Gln) amidotransferase subunit C